MPVLDITLPALHPGQQAVYDSPARFRVVAAGRRWQKTTLGAIIAVETALAGKRVWWVAPSYPMAREVWRIFKRVAAQIPQSETNEVERRLSLLTGGMIEVKSADAPVSLRGVGLDFLVVDEAAFIDQEVWTAALRPTLTERLGKGLFLSTPKGHNWFYRAWQLGQDSNQPEWASWQFPTANNPYIQPSEIEAARRDSPESVFAQEYLAAFTDDAGAVFRNVRLCAIAAPQEKAVEGHQYVIGVDWGKMQDFTVFALIDITLRQCVHTDRMNVVDYAVQRGRLFALWEAFASPPIVAESNSMGEPILEDLRRDGLPVQGFTTTNATKSAIIESLMLAFEQRTIGIIPDGVLTSELESYASERLPSGLTRYGAPSGMHDDTVMALAIGWYAATKPPAILETSAVNPFYS